MVNDGQERTPAEGTKKMKLLTIAEVAEAMKVSEKTVRRLIKRGDLPAFQLGERGQLRIDENELHRYVESQRVRRETLFVAPSEAESEG